LKTDTLADYLSRPALLRERYQNHRGRIVIDEIQKARALLDEVHRLIEKTRTVVHSHRFQRAQTQTGARESFGRPGMA